MREVSMEPVAATHEQKRLEALRSYNILNLLPEKDLDDMVRMASCVCDTPVALITLLDEDNQWFKARFGTELNSTPRNLSFCHYAIQGDDVFEVADAAVHEVFANNPLVTGEPNIRFYAGAPLITPDGYKLGTLCVMDTVSKQLSQKQKNTLKTLSSFAINYFELVKKKNELQESQDLYLKMVEEAGDIIYTCSAAGNFVYLNKSIAKLAGYEVNELIGKHFSYLIAPGWGKKVTDFYCNQLNNKTPETTFEFPIRTRDGVERWIEQRVVLIMQDNEVKNLQGVVRDIDERKHMEKQLIESMALAEQSAKAKELFLANMSHEIRTPLNGVLGFTDLLAKTNLSKEQKEFVDIICTSGKNLMQIINDILDYSKIEAGMLTIEKTSLSIRCIFSSMAVLFSPRAGEKNLDLEFKTHAAVPGLLVGDPIRFTQILTNLVSNAIKFTNKGSVKIYASLVGRTGNKVTVKIAVSDTGIGIASDKLGSIFERFNQASNDISRDFGGTGLGLSIVKNLAELQGGNVSVQSKPGKGSEFTFVLPFEVIAQLPQKQLAQKARLNQNDNLKLNILLVEDSVMNQKLAQRVLSNFGFTTQVAENGREAISKLEKGKYDLIIMDMQMPVMDGYEATGIIRKQLKSNIPILAMTAHAMASEREKCFSIGMNEYISKPFDIDDLYAKIKHIATAVSNAIKTPLMPAKKKPVSKKRAAAKAKPAAKRKKT